MTPDQIFYSAFLGLVFLWGYIRVGVQSKRVGYDSPSDAVWSFLPTLGFFGTLLVVESAEVLAGAGATLTDWWITLAGGVCSITAVVVGWTKTTRNTARANHPMGIVELQYLVLFKVLCSTVAVVLGAVAFSSATDEKKSISDRIAPVLMVLMLLIVFFMPLFNGDAVRDAGNAPEKEY